MIGEDVGGCGYVVEHMVTLGSGSSVPAASEASAAKAADKFVRLMDKDGDGVVSPAEIVATNNQRNRGGDRRTIQELVAFHDVNRFPPLTRAWLDIYCSLFGC